MYKKIIILLSFCLLSLIIIFGCLLAFGVISPSLFGTFRHAQTTEREFQVELPFKKTITKLAFSDIQEKMMQDLGVRILESEKKENNINFASILTGNLNAEMTERVLVEKEDARLGKLLLKMEILTKVTPQKVEIISQLMEPGEKVKGLQQIITISPLPSENMTDAKKTVISKKSISDQDPIPLEETSDSAEKTEKKKDSFASSFFKSVSAATGIKQNKTPEKTHIHIKYFTDVLIPYPEISFIRKEVVRQVKTEHEKTINILERLLKETCESK
ncbi:MAG: hypothetical protein Q4C96_05715 [Planctomycetia bacterium]|nr:hypothetical protein [Planctomycetia bacterium]